MAGHNFNGSRTYYAHLEINKQTIVVSANMYDHEIGIKPFDIWLTFVYKAALLCSCRYIPFPQL